MIQLRVHACLQVYMGVTLDGPERVSLGWTASLRPYRTHPCYSVATDFSLYPARVTIATVVNRRQYYAHRSQSNLTTVAPNGTASLASGLLMLGNFEILPNESSLHGTPRFYACRIPLVLSLVVASQLS